MKHRHIRNHNERRRLAKLARQPFGPWDKRVTTPAERRAFGMRSSTWRNVAYVNNRYSVQISDLETNWGEVVHLWIRRHDERMVTSWADMQRIKDELVGTERVAVQVFPPSDQLVDQANMAHLWVLPEGMELPFGLHVGAGR